MNRFLELKNSMRTKYLKSMKIYDDPDVNKIFWYSSILGGIITTKKIKPTFKKIWLVWNIASILVMLTMNVLFYLWYGEKDIRTSLKLSQPLLAMTAAYSTWITFAIYQKNSEQFTDNIDMYMKNNIFDEEISDVRAKITLHEIILGTMPTSLFMMELVRKLFLPDSVFLREVTSFTYPFADKFQPNSATIATVIYFVQFLTTLSLSMTIFSTLHLLQILVVLTRRNEELLRKQIRTISSSTMQQLESSHNEELAIEQDDLGERNRLVQVFVTQRDKISRNFGKEMEYWSKRWHQMKKSQNFMHPLFELTSSWFVALIHVMQIPLGEQIISVMYDPSKFSASTFHAFCFFILNTYFLYQICCIAEKINDRWEEFQIEVYSTPWYMLPKDHRKDIGILLTLASRIQSVRVFKTKPIGMPLFSELLDSWYSNVSVLRELLRKFKK